MGFKDFFRGDRPSLLDYEVRSSLENPQTPLSFPAEWLLDIYNGGRTDSGIRVSQLTALQTIVIKRCVEVIAATIGSLPFHIYEVKPGANGHKTRTIADDHPDYDKIHARPNTEMVHKTLMETWLAHALLWGNGYIEIIWSVGGEVLGLYPRNPAKTRPYRLLKPLFLEGGWEGGKTYPAGQLVYVTTDGIQDYDMSETDAAGLTRAERVILPDNMLHLPGLSLDGRIGMDTIEYARQTVGRKLAMEKFGSKFFGNGGRTSMIIKLPGNMSQEQRDAARKSYQEALGGENMMRPIVLTSGIEIDPIEIKANEGQFVETESATANELCALFGVPGHMVGIMEKTSRANTEQFAQEFYQYCLFPWLEAINQEFRAKILDEPAKIGRPGKKYTFDFDIDNLIRPDADSRQKFYSTGFSTGALSSNDIRVKERMNPRTDEYGDAYYVPVNVMRADQPPPAPEPNDPGNNPANPDSPDKQGTPGKNGFPEADFGGGTGSAHSANPPTPPTSYLPDVLQQRYKTVYFPIFSDAFNRALVKKKPTSEVLFHTFAPVLTAISGDLLGEVSRMIKQEKPKDDVLAVFVKDYAGAMAKRFASWTAESVKHELDRAVRAIGAAAFKEMGWAQMQQFRSQPVGGQPVAYLIEHGATEYTESGKMHGDNDADLNAKGQQQATKAAAWLKQNAPAIKAVYSSNLKRAVQTAQPIAEAFNTKVNQDQELRPMRIGDLSGKPESELKPYLDNPDTSIPNGDSLNSFAKGRGKRALDYIKEARPEQQAALVLHSMNIATTSDSIEHDDPIKNLLKTKAELSQGGIMSVWRMDDGSYQLHVEY